MLNQRICWIFNLLQNIIPIFVQDLVEQGMT